MHFYVALNLPEDSINRSSLARNEQLASPKTALKRKAHEDLESGFLRGVLSAISIRMPIVIETPMTLSFDALEPEASGQARSS